MKCESKVQASRTIQMLFHHKFKKHRPRSVLLGRLFGYSPHHSRTPLRRLCVPYTSTIASLSKDHPVLQEKAKMVPASIMSVCALHTLLGLTLVTSVTLTSINGSKNGCIDD